MRIIESTLVAVDAGLTEGLGRGDHRGRDGGTAGPGELGGRRSWAAQSSRSAGLLYRPGGQVRWAVRSTDPNNSELRDFPDRSAAEASYEDEVRQLSDCSDVPLWDHTDVEDVPEARYTLVLEHQDIDDDGQPGNWTIRRRHEGILGTYLLDLDDFPGSLEEVACGWLRFTAAEQALANQEVVLARAAGYPDYEASVVYRHALRVTVTGNSDPGEVTLTDVMPEIAHPTTEQIRDYIARLEAVDDALSAP